jgi:Holliday junction DNA helicase RuvA
MIARVEGRLVEKGPTRLVVDCHGIGFEFGTALSTSAAVSDEGTQVVLYVDTYFSRDSVRLFGFATPDERDLFRQLTGVKGIGPRAGLNLLSRLGVSEIREAIRAGRLDVMLTVPGIGPRKADAIMRKLQESVGDSESASPLLADAESALVSLGLTRREAKGRLSRIAPGARTLEELLRLALAARD